MKIGMTLPVMEPDLTRKDLEKWTKKIDTGPWSHIALGERILFPNPEFISTLSAVSAWTNRVEIIATVSILTMHNPILSAKQFATIDMLAEGRFTLGVGVGGREEDYTAINSNWSARRWATLAKNVKTMQSVWSKDYHKEMGPNTFSKAGPQILAGAVGPKAMSMSADFAEGLAGFSFNADLKEINDSLRRRELGEKRKLKKLLKVNFGGEVNPVFKSLSLLPPVIVSTVKARTSILHSIHLSIMDLVSPLSL